MLFDLPTHTQADYDGYSKTRDPTNRYTADLSLDTRITVVTLYGAPLQLTPPLLVHAALLSYFARLEKRAVYQTMEGDITTPLVPGQPPNFTYRLPTLRDSRIYDTDFYRYGL